MLGAVSSRRRCVKTAAAGRRHRPRSPTARRLVSKGPPTAAAALILAGALGPSGPQAQARAAAGNSDGRRQLTSPRPPKTKARPAQKRAGLTGPGFRARARHSLGVVLCRWYLDREAGPERSSPELWTLMPSATGRARSRRDRRGRAADARRAPGHGARPAVRRAARLP